MSVTSRRARALWILAGAQALAFAALAQTPDRTPPDTARPLPAPAAGESTPRDRHDGKEHMDQTAMKKVTPQSFATQAAVIGKAEVELGQLALQKTQDEQVRKYAQRMVKDHTAAAEKLKTIAAKQNIPLPQSLDAEHQALKQKLSGLQGEAFDREYTKAMSKGHDKAVALFESASQTQQMPSQLKEFAAATLPTLEEHRELAHDLHKKEGA